MWSLPRSLTSPLSASRAWGLSLVLLMAVSLSACTIKSTRPHVPLPEVTTEQLSALLREREAAVQTMKGLFQVQIQGPGIPLAQRVEGAMFYRRPDVLRLQGFNRLGGKLFEFVLGADVYTLRLPAGQVMSGRPAELERMGKVAQPFKLSVLAMSGVVGIAPVSERERATVVIEGDRYRLDVFPLANRVSDAPEVPFRRIWFDGRLQVVQEDRVTADGDVQATAQFDDYRPVHDTPGGDASAAAEAAPRRTFLKPFRITAQDGRGQGIIMLTFREMVPNALLKADELRITDVAVSESGMVR